MNENAQKWIAALRERGMEQTTGILHEVADEGDRFCCLGVACKLYEEENPGMLSIVTSNGDDSGDDRTHVRYNDNGHALPAMVQRWLGLQTETGSYAEAGDFTSSSLSSKNDGGASFKDIADIIESEPRNLFAP